MYLPSSNFKPWACHIIYDLDFCQDPNDTVSEPNLQ